MPFRQPFLVRLFSLLLGILFLNLSIILTEISAFDLEKKNKALYERLVSLIPDTALEEENGTSGESSTELSDDLSPYIHITYKFYLLQNHDIKFSQCCIMSVNLLNSYLEVFSPPPES